METTGDRRRPRRRYTGTMSLMGKEGDIKYRWNKNNPTEVDIARKTFEKYRKEGYLAFRMTDGNRGEMMTEFDPDAERILFSPPMQGG